MENSKIKTVGTREEVYKGLASRTAGNLQKNDIIEKIIGNRKLYISKKISEKMKENINIFRTNNPNFFKSMHKKTIVANNIESNNKDINNKDINNKDVNNQNSSNNQNNSNNQNVNKKNLNKEDLNKKKI